MSIPAFEIQANAPMPTIAGLGGGSSTAVRPTRAMVDPVGATPALEPIPAGACVLDPVGAGMTFDP